MAFEIITLNLIPDGEMPVFHASQFDTARPVIIDLVMGEDAYVVPEGITLELHCRKVDDTIVTMEPDEVSENRVTFVTTEQLTACIGDNLCEVALLNGDDHIGTLNFILHVEPDPLAGGLTSESDIYNLTQQIKDISQEVIGEDYYDKTEVDVLLADKADVSDLPDMSNYYTKTQVYNKTEVDNIIDNIFPTLSASGDIASFITALNKPLVSVSVEEGATTITRCGKNLFDINRHNESASAIFTLNDDGSLTIENTAAWAISIYWIYTGLLPAGEYNIKNLSNDSFYLQFSENDYSHNISANGSYTFNYDGNSYIRLLPANLNAGVTKTFNMQIEIGTVFTEYEKYIGQTVPVAEAETLITLSGSNNVFADAGIITVQYKYMSI